MKFAITHSGITVTCFGANKRELIKDIDDARQFVVDQVSVNLIKPKKKKRAPAKKKEQPASPSVDLTDGEDTGKSSDPGFQAKIISPEV